MIVAVAERVRVREIDPDEGQRLFADRASEFPIGGDLS
jgi:hypothetical protein